MNGLKTSNLFKSSIESISGIGNIIGIEFNSGY